MACACPWELDHSPGPSADGGDTCLLQVKCWGGGCAPSDHLGSPQPLKGHCSQLHHQLPAAVIPLELIRRSCFSRLVLSSALPAPLCCPCRQGAGTLTGAGETQDRGTLLLLSLQRAVWEGGREGGWSLWVSPISGGANCCRAQ